MEVGGTASGSGFFGQDAIDYEDDKTTIRATYPVTVSATHAEVDINSLRNAFDKNNGQPHYIDYYFDVDTTVEVRIAYSFRSLEQARSNLAAAPATFDAAKTAAEGTWTDHLSRLDSAYNPAGRTETEKQIFYSALYHSLTKPSICDDESPWWSDSAYVTDFSTLWDVYKSQLPLVFKHYPEHGEKIIKGMVNAMDYVATQQSYGYVPVGFFKAHSLTAFRGQCTGMEWPVLAYGYDMFPSMPASVWSRALSHVPGFASTSRVEEIIANGKGSGLSYSHTLDTASAFDSIAYLAEQTGDTATFNTYASNRDSWINGYDPATGLMKNIGEYYEGTNWNYSFRPHYDMGARVELAGGPEAFADLLDEFFGYADIADGSVSATDPTPGVDDFDRLIRHDRFEGLNNELDMEAPYAYLWSSKPERVQEIIDAIMQYQFAPGPNGLPGNNDSGATSSWYVLNAIGEFPLIEARANYQTPIDSSDTTAPTPITATWASIPSPQSDSAIQMTATTGTDANIIQYYFEETSGNTGGSDSGWQMSPTYTDTGLLPSTQYTYVLRMRDVIGNAGNDSASASATTQIDATPPLPTVAEWDNEPTENGEDSISMSAVIGTDPTGPVQYYFDETSGNPGGTDSGWQNSNSYTDDGLDAETEYTYVVRMRDGLNNTGTDSAPASATTDAINTDFDAPTPNASQWVIQPKADSDTAISMAAIMGSDLSPPIEYYFEETSGNTGGTDSGWQSSNSYTDTGLTANIQYSYVVRMRDRHGNTGANSITVSTNTEATPVPDSSAPSPEVADWATVPTAITDASITMTATTGFDVNGPVEYYFEETSGNAGGADSGWQSSNSYTNTGLSPNTNYTYLVRMRDALGNVGTDSSSAAATTLASAPEPTVIRVDFGDDSHSDNIDVSNGKNWNTITTATTYNLKTGNGGTGTDTGYDLTLSSGWAGSGTNGIDGGAYKPSVFNESGSLNEGAEFDVLRSNTSGAPVQFTISGFSPSNTVEIQLAAASRDSGDSNITDFSINGAFASNGGNDFDVYANSQVTDGTGTILTWTLNGASAYTLIMDPADGEQGGINGLIISVSGGGVDVSPPTPNAATWASAPVADSFSSITMAATTGNDASGPIQYYFEETSGNPGGTDSGWQTSNSYTDTELSNETEYSYIVRMRDALGNTGSNSAPAAAATGDPNGYAYTLKVDFGIDDQSTKVDFTNGNNWNSVEVSDVVAGTTLKDTEGTVTSYAIGSGTDWNSDSSNNLGGAFDQSSNDFDNAAFDLIKTPAEGSASLTLSGFALTDQVTIRLAAARNGQEFNTGNYRINGSYGNGAAPLNGEGYNVGTNGATHASEMTWTLVGATSYTLVVEDLAGYQATINGMIIEVSGRTEELDPDSDNDGLTDSEEATAGTDPNDPDSDDDGLSDGKEVNELGTDPNNGNSSAGGMGDLLYYALDAGSFASEAMSQPTLVPVGNAFEFSIPKTTASDIDYSIEISIDLSTWYRVAHRLNGAAWQKDTTADTTPVYPNINDISVTPDTTGVTISEPSQSEPRFFRSKVESQSEVN
jgi:chitodextrinase